VSRPLDVVLGRLGASKPGNCRCPAHEDRLASLSVSVNEADTVLLRCHAGCTIEAVMSSLGLPMSALFVPRDARDDRRQGVRSKIVATYDYTDADGKMIYQVVRFDPKDFRQRRRDGDRWIWNIKGCQPVLFRLPQVLEAIEQDCNIYLAEGERDVLALEAAGMVATTNAMGAGKWRDEYTTTLAGSTVIVIADADDPGRRHAAKVAAALRGASCHVSVMDPAPGFKDAAEHLGAGKGLGDFVVWPEETIAKRAIGPLLENYWGGDDYLDRGDEVIAPWAVPGLIRVNWRIVFVGVEGHGKALDCDTPILTNRGWQTMADVKVGDSVRHPDGGMTEVLACTAAMFERPCYRVTFDNGSEIVADAQHLWRTEIWQEGKGIRPELTTTSQMAATIMAGCLHYVIRSGSKFHYVIAVEPVESRPVRCIQVDSADGMYLAGREMIPTHNSVLLRELAICAANGIHPLRFTPIPPVRTMIIDLENPDEAIIETARPLRDRAHVERTTPVERNTWHIWTEPAGLDLRNKRDQDRFAERVELHRPQLICIGPAYKLHPEGRDNDNEAVRAVMDFLDRVRMAYGFGLILEHHAAKAQVQHGKRDLVPFGTSLWLRWPDLGFKMVPKLDEHGAVATAETMRPSVIELRPFKGMRLKNVWPAEIHRNEGQWPWVGHWPDEHERSTRYFPPDQERNF